MPIRQIISRNIMLTSYENIKPKPANQKEKEEYPTERYYGKVYLCYEENPTTYGPIIGFNCYKYKSYEEANKASREMQHLDIRHTIIPICKWVPEIFHTSVLNWKLKQMYWLGGIYRFGIGWDVKNKK